MKSRALALVLASSVLASGAAHADACNLADLLFGKVSIGIVYNKEFQYETCVIFGNDTENKRFAFEKVLGTISGTDRVGDRTIRNANGDMCGGIDENMVVEGETGSCTSCAAMRLKLQKVGQTLAVMQNSRIMGTIEGRLPK